MPTPTLPPPSIGAMKAAKKLWPLGCGSYCYATHEENEAAKQKDWEAVAREIDAQTGIPALVASVREFCAKVDRGEARSVRTYNAFSAWLENNDTKL